MAYNNKCLFFAQFHVNRRISLLWLSSVSLLSPGTRLNGQPLSGTHHDWDGGDMGKKQSQITQLLLKLLLGCGVSPSIGWNKSHGQPDMIAGSVFSQSEALLVTWQWVVMHDDSTGKWMSLWEQQCNLPHDPITTITLSFPQQTMLDFIRFEILKALAVFNSLVNSSIPTPILFLCSTMFFYGTWESNPSSFLYRPYYQTTRYEILLSSYVILPGISA